MIPHPSSSRDPSAGVAEPDGMLHESLELHCIGGFVFTYFYGLPRTTGDIDYDTAIRANLNVDEVAGQGSPLHTKHGVWLHRICTEHRLTDHAPMNPQFLGDPTNRSTTMLILT